ncbi:MAG: tRNA 2-thiocytidine biosynthesis TtcA family protein [Anaerolineae bacterium]
MIDPESVARYLLKPVNRAVWEYGLLAAGDHIAVGVSGGKDSRTLLDLLVRGVDVPGEYRVLAVHVDGSAAGLPDLRPTLEPWFRALGVAYEIVPLTLPEEEPRPPTCFRCAWHRRKTLFRAAARRGCNKVALGHHADDAAVTALMNVLYQGRLETMRPRVDFFEGELTLIRPLILAEEVEIRRYARACGWPLPDALTCPQAETTRRAKIEAFFRSFDKREYEQMRTNLWRLTTEH